MSSEPHLITRLLRESSHGNSAALDELMPLVYEQLHRLAMSCMRDERGDHTLRATALVHEAYLRLVDSDVEWASRAHFFAVAARLLRRILVDHARAHTRHKRGGEARRVDLDEVVLVGPKVPTEILDLDEALDRLAEVDRRKSEVIQLIFFGGLTYDEASTALGISPATLHRDLALAKAWLYRELSLSHGASA